MGEWGHTQGLAHAKQVFYCTPSPSVMVMSLCSEALQWIIQCCEAVTARVPQFPLPSKVLPRAPVARKTLFISHFLPRSSLWTLPLPIRQLHPPLLPKTALSFFSKGDCFRKFRTNAG